jgi:hypothetical protein
MKTQQEYALEQVVQNLKRAVLEQESKCGYIFWYHPEVKRK